MQLPPNVQADVDKVEGRIVQAVEGPWLRLRVQTEAVDLASVRAELAGLEQTLRGELTDEELLAWAKRAVPQLPPAQKQALQDRRKELAKLLRDMGAA